jgi:hypothetical protein
MAALTASARRLMSISPVAMTRQEVEVAHTYYRETVSTRARTGRYMGIDYQYWFDPIAQHIYALLWGYPSELVSVIEPNYYTQDAIDTMFNTKIAIFLRTHVGMFTDMDSWHEVYMQNGMVWTTLASSSINPHVSRMGSVCWSEHNRRSICSATVNGDMDVAMIHTCSAFASFVPYTGYGDFLDLLGTCCHCQRTEFREHLQNRTCRLCELESKEGYSETR